MRTGKSGASWSQLWKRNAVVVAIALFVCAAVYLNWNYEQEAQAGKTLGQSAMVGSETGDPLVKNVAGDGVSQQDGTGDTETSAAAGDYFATARLNRQQARDSALSLLQDAAAREGADETVKTQVNDTIQTMAYYTVTEAQIENLVVAKGYADCVAFIGEDSLSLAVSVPEGGLTEADTAKIVDVVNQTAGFTADQIKIIEVE
ncbi:SpoIIIAH-like family protein [Pseudoflavonifractor phocaeensis]|uniref:SpoIIIAH-like family protein n=1 Tax=Pseudoflavonifractor phocaeensis TaxID=1870988 RepID=UPI001F432CE7|nr:SpoIIIAH-like family protein [Pseudoflavonifractor phocaeensis]MCF2661269.1 SpoIIIAH-like family protein [Pseudoflavonifractor phocaeensis]